MEGQAFDDLLIRTRAFVRGEGRACEPETERTGTVSRLVLNALQGLGTYGWSIPVEYGGLGLTTEQLALAFLELSQGAVAYRVVGATNAGVGSEALIQDGTEAQKEAYLPRLASGELLGCLALTEPEAGSDATSLKTRGELQSDGSYILNGTKCFITMAPLAGLFTVLARTGDQERGGKGISAFLVERDTPGLKLSTPTPMMGQEGAPIGSSIRPDMPLPAAIDAWRRVHDAHRLPELERELQRMAQQPDVLTSTAAETRLLRLREDLERAKAAAASLD